MSAPRRCKVCGRSLDGRDSRAVTCSPSCRRERRRVLAILTGSGDGPYACLAEYQGRARRVRAKRPSAA